VRVVVIFPIVVIVIVIVIVIVRSISEKLRPFASMAAAFDLERAVRDIMTCQQVAYRVLDRVSAGPSAKRHNNMRVQSVALFVNHPKMDMVHIGDTACLMLIVAPAV
jgi:hypothetical protein